MPSPSEKTRASALRSLLDGVFRAGVSSGMDLDLAKRVTVTNQLSATLCVLCVPYVFVFFGLGSTLLGGLTVLLIAGFSAIILLNKLGHNWLSRVSYVVLTNAANFVYGMAMGPRAGFQLFYFTTMAVPFVLFSWEERKSRLGGVSLGVVLMLAFEVIQDYRGDTHVLAPVPERVLFYLILVTAQFIYLMVILYLILGNRRTEAALAEAMEAAKAADKAKTRFLANMSHEIRTPMNGILGLSELLSRARLNPHDAESVTAIRSSARDLLEIINEILDLSKIEAGKMRLERVPFDLRRLLSRLRPVFSSLAETKGLTWKLETAPDVPPRLIGDPVRIRQVLTNLIGNAFKFTRHGGVTLRIRQTALVEEGLATVSFEVEDTGAGIPRDAQPGIFHAFSQADESTARKYGGTGLGLHISKQIVEMMGGTIGFRTEQGKGSVFHFSVPLPIASPETSPVDEWTGSRVPRDDHRLFQGLRVLVVDDQHVNRRVLSGMLSLYGVRVDTASNGLEAVEACGRTDYDLVFLDSHMPEMDGYRCCKALRADESGKRRRVIIGCTADAMAGSREKCLEAGMDDMITKPVLEESLAAALNRWAPKDPGLGARSAVDVPPAKGAAPDEDTDEWLDLHQVTQMTVWTEAYDRFFWEKMLSDFEASYRRLTLSIRKECNDGNFQNAGDAAHALKGVSAMMGFPRMAEICKSLEALGSGGETAEWPALFAKLEASYDPSMGAIRKRLAAKGRVGAGAT